jgi:type I site-specific restriction endonuclease
MIGRGSRVLPNKKEFSIIDLGNNMNRFGLWDNPIDWQHIFAAPESYLNSIMSDEEIERNYRYTMPDEVRSRFSKSETIDFDVTEAYYEAIDSLKRPKEVVEQSLQQHIRICLENSLDTLEALELADLLKEEIQFRIRSYTNCLRKTSESYVKWLQDDYTRRLKFGLIRRSADYNLPENE